MPVYSSRVGPYRGDLFLPEREISSSRLLWWVLCRVIHSRTSSMVYRLACSSYGPYSQSIADTILAQCSSV